MKATAKVLAAAVLLTVTVASTGVAQVGVSGVNGITVPPETDVLLSVPVSRPVEEALSVDGAPSGTTLPVAAGALAGSSYDDAYYVRFTSGAAEGLWSTVVSNSDDDVTITDAAVAALVADGDAFRIHAHQTVGSLFPKLHYDWSYTSGTQILLFDNQAAGQFKVASDILQYRTVPVPGWTSGGAATVIPPESMFILRNNSSTKTLHYAHAGLVPDYTVSYLLPAGVDKDILIGSGYPTGTTVTKTGFGGVAGRQLLMFDNQATGRFKVADDILQYRTVPVPGWTSGGGSTPVPASEGFIFRQSSSDPGGVIRTVRPY